MNKFGIIEGIGFGIINNLVSKFRKNLVPKKVLDSVLFRFWVSSHTASKDEERDKKVVSKLSMLVTITHGVPGGSLWRYFVDKTLQIMICL